MGEGSIRSRAYKLMEILLGKTSSITLTCCESEDEVARTLCKRTAYIETGVNISELSSSLDSIEPKKNSIFTVFTIGRVCTQKQPQLFNQIAELVPNVKFVWIGSGELERILTAPNIEVTGWKSRRETLAIAKEADAFVLCSLGEAIAMSLLEMMYMRKLCLVSDVVGNRSVIQNEKNGFICREAQDYATVIKTAMKKIPQNCIERAYSDILIKYNTEKMKECYLRFYEKYLEEQA
jgi:glycosyltransferase involved in cell wall biosynthesis